MRPQARVLLCVPVLGLLSAQPFAMGVASWALYVSRGPWRYWTPLQAFAALRTLAEFFSGGVMEAWLALALAAPFALPSCGVHLSQRLRVLASLVNLAMLCPSRCAGLLLLSEALYPTYGPKAKSRSRKQSTKERSAA